MGNWFVEVIGWVIVGTGIVLLIAALYTVPVWLLWNWLMPTIFGINKITLLQAFGLMILSGLLFRGRSNKKSDD